MKTNKPLEEAIFRAPESTDENKQPQQEKLYHMGSKPESSKAQPPQEDLVDESHVKRMETFQNLRKLEYEVEKNIKGKRK